MAGDAAKTVYAALASNVAVTVLKYVAAAISGSSGMLTEAIHSTADTINQLLLLYGQHRTKAPTDQTHQFGYGLETYFWTFIVGFLVLLLGGGVALYEGVAHMRAGTPVSHPGLALGVLAASAVLDGASFVFGLRMYRLIVKGERVGGRRIGLWSFIRMSKDPGLFETLLEDAAALAGVVLAVAGIVGSVWLHLRWADGLASILIGLLLVADALVIMEATRNLIAGESVAAPVFDRLRQRLDERAGDFAPVTLRTLQLGPEAILVAIGLDREAIAKPGFADFVAAIRVDLTAVDDRITDVLFSADPAAPTGASPTADASAADV